MERLRWWADDLIIGACVRQALDENRSLLDGNEGAGGADDDFLDGRFRDRAGRDNEVVHRCEPCEVFVGVAGEHAVGDVGQVLELGVAVGHHSTAAGDLGPGNIVEGSGPSVRAACHLWSMAEDSPAVRSSRMLPLVLVALGLVELRLEPVQSIAVDLAAAQCLCEQVGRPPSRFTYRMLTGAGQFRFSPGLTAFVPNDAIHRPQVA